MYIFKGFCSIDAFASNVPGSCSPLGELSNISNSYAIERGYYSDTDYPSIELISFTSRLDGTAVEVPSTHSELLLSIANWLFSQSISGTFNDSESSCQSQLLAVFGTQIKNVELGQMTIHKGCWLPAYVAWELETSDTTAAASYRLWFSDEAFKSQYDDYQIVVIPPIDTLDTFASVKSVVTSALANFSVPKLHTRVLAATGGEPYTTLVSYDYTWHDRESVETTLQTTWTVAIYGAAGNNIDAIKAALVEYIMTNSSYLRDVWTLIFPDIFTSTEFLIVPLWHRRSVVDATARGSLYSPVTPPYDGLLSLAAKFIPYEPEHIKNNLTAQSIQYKSLCTVIVGGPENRDLHYQITDMFPDYAIISTQSVDFNRMSSNTTGWIQKLVTAIIAAEEMSEYSYIGAELSRIKKDGLLWVGFSYDDVSYRVLARSSLEANV